jgi:AraC-like DNA-binding protein
VRERCGIRTNNISSRFRWALGIGLRDYIEARRMEAADHLLRTSDVGIFDLAMALGYEHETTFYRAFRRHFGCTPAASRRKCQERRPRPKSRRGCRVEMQG